MTSQPSDRITLTLFDRYLAGECTPVELVLVERWLMASPERRVVARALRSAAPIHIDVDANLSRVREHMMPLPGILGERSAVSRAYVRRGIDQGVKGGESKEHLLPANVTSRAMDRPTLGSSVPTREKSARPALKGIRVLGTQILRRVGWYAASALVFSALVTILAWNAGMRHVSQRAAASLLTYTTRNGERATITLPDGGTVALNVASQLQVPLDYMAGDRTVRLVGEGLFTVPHRDGAPFTVLAGGTAARVLGTSFVVRHYATDSLTTVAVRDGKVAVRSVVLTAARMVEIERTGAAHVLMADPAQFSFANGVLILNGGLLPDVVPELNRWYNVDIRLGDSTLRTQRMLAKLTAGSLSDLTNILEGTFDVRVVRVNRVLTLYPR